MKLVHYLPRIRLAEGGVVRAVLDMAALLAMRGHAVTVATHDAADAPPEWRSGGPRIALIPTPKYPGGLMSDRQLRALHPLIQESDVVHLHTPWERTNLQIARRCRRLGTPYVVTIHGMLDDWCMSQKGPKKRLFLALGGRAMLDHAAWVHCTAEAERRQASRYFSSPGVVIPLVLDLAEYRSLPGTGPAAEAFPGAARALASGEPILLFLSRLHPKKGVEALIDAAIRLRDRGALARVLIAGPGEADYQRALRARAGPLGERVEFLGLVGGRAKVALYQCATVFVLPTSQENFGFVVPEALACGVPAITTRGVDIWPELEASGGAIIADPPTPEVIADHIGALIADPARRDRMGRSGREWVLAMLNPDRIVGQFEEAYARAKAGHAGQRGDRNTH